MTVDLEDLKAFVAVARAEGFRDGARASGTSASRLSSAVRRVEEQMGTRLLNRTTRSVALTEAGRTLLDRLAPALTAVEDALQGVQGTSGKASGVLRLNVPISAARLILPSIVPGFLAAYPDIRLEVVAESGFVDVLASGCDAGIRYDDKLEQDMIAIPIGPREQRFAAGASPAYLDAHGRPRHPRDLLGHACLRGRFNNSPSQPWLFQRNGKVIQVDAQGPLMVTNGGATDLAVNAAIAGTGVVFIFEGWLQPHFDSGALEPVLKNWWYGFSGPFLYYPGRRLVPPPLRAFVDHVKALNAAP